MEVHICKCKRCGKEWIRRKKGEPKQCVHCKSTYWNKEYIRKRRREAWPWNKMREVTDDKSRKRAAIA